MSYRDQTVLVTGGNGLIGANLIPHLVELGARVRATLHSRPALVHDARLEYVQADLTRAEDCRRAVEGQRYVFMTAANSSGAAAISSSPMIHVTPNVLMNVQMLEAAYEAGVEKFIWLSSTTGYPDRGMEPLKEEEMFDGDPYDKYFFVGWMKRFTEKVCEMYGARLSRTMSTIVLRPTNVYGPYDDFELATSHVTPALVRKVIERWDPIEVWSNGEEIRDLIYVEDMVEVMLRAGERLDGHVVMNVGLGKGYKVRQLLDLLLDIDGYRNANVVFDRSKPSMIPARLVDTTMAQRRLDFCAQIDLPEGLRRTVEWYRNWTSAQGH
ncbi:MAG: NAD-dependent epimerase/dehydratase family protein [Chloroflexota bacterium]